MAGAAAVAQPEGGVPPPDMAARLRFLVSPAAHAPGSGPVQLTETHMSWLVLDDRQVLKLKKPVCYPPFLDCRTLAQRHQDAQAEVRLNQRLAPGVYLGLLALQWRSGDADPAQGFRLVPEATLSAAGEAAGDTTGALVLDWLVQMRRLPADRMLDALIAAGQLQPAQVEALAQVLGRFYRHARPAAITPGQYLAHLHDEQQRNRAALADPRWALADAPQALGALDAALVQQAPALARRARLGHVVDGHGDLRPEHVCLADPPLVIDCLTFSDLLRQVDPFDELAALALDCERLGAPWVGPLLIERCAQRLEDDPPPALLRLYRCARALLRARLAVNHLLDAVPRDPDRWLAKARAYLALALQAAP